jgi:hypothetical protein
MRRVKVLRYFPHHTLEQWKYRRGLIIHLICSITLQ